MSEPRRRGPVPTGIDKQQTSVRLTPHLRARLDAARGPGESLSALVPCLLAEALNARKAAEDRDEQV